MKAHKPDIDNEAAEEKIPGLWQWRNSSGYLTVCVHYSADKDTASKKEREHGMVDKARYNQEHELSFSTPLGKPAFEEFSVAKHVMVFGVDPRRPVWRGWDFGYHRPAVVWLQPPLWVIGEVMGEDMTLEQFLRNQVMPYQSFLFGPSAKSIKFFDAADPAGKQVTDKSDWTSFSILSNHGIFPMAQPSAIDSGLEKIRNALVADYDFRVHPRCKILIEGFKGGYHYPTRRDGSQSDVPKKDGYYDNVFDALRYVAVNALHTVEEKPPAKPRKLTHAEEYVLKKNSELVIDEILGVY